MEKPKVGEVVRLNLPQIFEHCIRDDPQEIIKLSDKQYCSEVFKLNFAFFRTPAEIASTGEHKRYWTKVHHLLDHQVRVTSQWHARHLAPFVRYLVDKGLTPVGVSSAFVEAELDKLTAPKPASKTAPGGSRYRQHAIGNAQNAAVRYVLGNVGKESFTQKAWLEVKRWFGHRCAYCSSTHQLVMDHAVPISTAALGEHKLGNLVPACNDCNSDKGKLRYDDFLRGQRDRADAAARIATIEEHMAHHEYEPLSDLLSSEEVEGVRKLLRDLRDQVAEASASTIAAIDDVLAPLGKAES